MPISGISQGLGIGGGATATISGAPGGGGYVNEYSLTFDGGENNMDAGTSSDYSIVGGGSISYWIYPTITGLSAYAESAAKMDTGGWQIMHSPGGSAIAIVAYNHTYSGGYPTVTMNNPVNEWFLVSLVFHASGGATLYLNDGAAGASGTGQTSAKPSYSYTEDASAPLYFARHPTSLTRCFPGNMDEIAVFSSELSASDVEDIYNGGAPVDLGREGLNLSPVSWWRMGDSNPASPGAAVSLISDVIGGNNLTQSTASQQPTISSNVPS